MTLDEMIEELQRFRKMHPYAGKYPVCLSQPSHDYWKSQLAPEANEVLEAYVKYSDYHQTNKVTEDIDEIHERDDDPSSAKPVVLIDTINRW